MLLRIRNLLPTFFHPAVRADSDRRANNAHADPAVHVSLAPQRITFLSGSENKVVGGCVLLRNFQARLAAGFDAGLWPQLCPNTFVRLTI